MYANHKVFSLSVDHVTINCFNMGIKTDGFTAVKDETWTPPVTLANQIPSATTGICTIICLTYNGTAFVGSTQVTCT